MGSPFRKLVVPSSGSSTQRKSGAGPGQSVSSEPSSPRMPWDGKRREISRTRYSWVDLSAEVTGVQPVLVLVFYGKLATKLGRQDAPGAPGPAFTAAVSISCNCSWKVWASAIIRSSSSATGGSTWGVDSWDDRGLWCTHPHPNPPPSRGRGFYIPRSARRGGSDLFRGSLENQRYMGLKKLCR